MILIIINHNKPKKK